MIKKILFFLIVVALLVSITACDTSDVEKIKSEEEATEAIGEVSDDLEDIGEALDDIDEVFS
jgi:hypothetical protein